MAIRDRIGVRTIAAMLSTVTSAPRGPGRLATLEVRAPEAKVLIVTSAWPTPERPTYGIFIQRQVQSVIARGIDCEVLFVRGNESILAYVVATAMLLGWSLRSRRRYRLVHAHGEAALPARFYLGAPLLISYLGSDVNGAAGVDGTVSRAWRLRSGILRMAAHGARATITKSARMQTRLPPGPRSRNLVLPSGVNRDLFIPQPRAQARAALGWDEHEPVVLFAASPSIPNKRFALAQAACDHAAAKIGTIRLEVADAIPPEQMPRLMNAADCLILTSVAEGSSNVVKEALACNLPVVATAAGDAPELLAGVRGCAVCEPSPEALGDALARSLTAGERSDGREHTAELGEGRIADRLVGLYRELTGGTL